MKYQLKQFCKSLALVIVASLPMLLGAQTVATIAMNDGSTHEFEICTAGKISFSDNYLIIDDGNAVPFSFDMANIRTLKFSEVSSVEDIVTETFKIFPNPVHDNIFIAGNTLETFRYSIFAIDGRLLKNGEVRSGEAININSLPVGIHILKVNNSTFKINKI